MNKRERLIVWLANKIGVRMGERMPRWLFVLACILIPSRFLMALACRWYDPWLDVYTIGGKKITGAFFRALDSGPRWFRVVKNESGIITVEVLEIAP